MSTPGLKNEGVERTSFKPDEKGVPEKCRCEETPTLGNTGREFVKNIKTMVTK